MQYNFLTVLGAASIIAYAGAGALGINCRGSGACSIFTQTDGNNFPDKVINLLAQDFKGLDNNQHHNNGEHIACLPGQYELDDGITIHGGICAFLQKTTGGVKGDTLKVLIGDLQQHGCKVCGSVPTGFPGDNNVAHGELTLNFVNNIGNCNGLC